MFWCNRYDKQYLYAIAYLTVHITCDHISPFEKKVGIYSPENRVFSPLLHIVKGRTLSI
jgi:hypothetical protein